MRRAAGGTWSSHCPSPSSPPQGGSCRRVTAASRHPSGARWAARIPAWRARRLFPPASPRLRVWAIAAAAGERLLDEIETLIEPIAAEDDVGRVLPNRLDPSRPRRIMFLRRISKGSSPEQRRKIVHGAFDGEGGLRGAVAAKPAGRNHVGIDGVAIGLLVGAAVGRDWAGQRGCQRLAGVAAIGARVGHDTHLNRGQRAVAFGTELDMRGHRMARGGADELLLAGELPHHRTAGLQRGQRTQIFGDHLLLAAEARRRRAR